MPHHVCKLNTDKSEATINGPVTSGEVPQITVFKCLQLRCTDPGVLKNKQIHKTHKKNLTQHVTAVLCKRLDNYNDLTAKYVMLHILYRDVFVVCRFVHCHELHTCLGKQE